MTELVAHCANTLDTSGESSAVPWEERTTQRRPRASGEELFPPAPCARGTEERRKARKAVLVINIAYAVWRDDDHGQRYQGDNIWPSCRVVGLYILTRMRYTAVRSINLSLLETIWRHIAVTWPTVRRNWCWIVKKPVLAVLPSPQLGLELVEKLCRRPNVH